MTETASVEMDEHVQRQRRSDIGGGRGAGKMRDAIWRDGDFLRWRSMKYDVSAPEKQTHCLYPNLKLFSATGLHRRSRREVATVDVAALNSWHEIGGARRKLR